MLRTAIALGIVFLAAAPASAQFIGGGFVQRSGFGFSVHRPGFHFQARGYYSAPIFYYASPAVGFTWVPAFGPGYGPGFGNPFFLPAPPFPLPPPFVPPMVNEAPYELPPGVVNADFKVIAPRKKDDVAPAADRVVLPERPPMPRFDPFAKEKPVGLTEPALDVNRLMKLSRDALAAGEFGTATEHLDRVLAARPGDSTALFLKSQAQFAAGQYSESVATIRAGLNADWPAIAIQPRNLFGTQERFDSLFGDLKRSRDANPDSPALQFLVAHQHWFAGDRDLAKDLFRKLADRLNDADALKPFLK